MLLHSLEEDASPYMKDITTTIQQEQNQIIRDETQPLLLVNGLPVVENVCDYATDCLFTLSTSSRNYSG